MLYGVVLAGGKSSRMGTDKLALELNGRSLLQRAIDLLAQCGADQILISGDCAVLVDRPIIRIPDLAETGFGGPPLGLFTVLCWLERNSLLDGRKLLVLTGDMPLLNNSVLGMLLEAESRGRAVRFFGEVFPFLLHADQLTLDIMRKELTRSQEGVAFSGRKIGMQHMLQIWQAHAIEAVGIPDDCFTNVNSPEEWQKIRHSKV